MTVIIKVYIVSWYFFFFVWRAAPRVWDYSLGEEGAERGGTNAHEATPGVWEILHGGSSEARARFPDTTQSLGCDGRVCI